jgi:hypothetical protein
MNTIDSIINEELNKIFINEAKRPVSKEVLDAFKRFLKSRKGDKAADSVGGKNKGKKKPVKTKDIKTRKLAGGGTQRYDFNDWKRSNIEVNKDLANSIISKINMDTLDLAAAARKVFSSHTPEGAQSQLRKILKHERPMTYKVARKLNKMISQGIIPVK